MTDIRRGLRKTR